MKISEYIQYDAMGLAELIKQKQITPYELLNLVKRILNNINPKLNAVSNIFFDKAEKQLETLDLSAPLAGVPFAIKDLGVLYEGTVTTNGSRYFSQGASDHSSEIINRYLNAGLIIFGKTNTPEMGVSYTTEPTFTGPTHNP